MFIESSSTFYIFLSTTTPPSSSRRVVIDSTTTQGIRLRQQVDVFSTTSDTIVARYRASCVVNFMRFMHAGYMQVVMHSRKSTLTVGLTSFVSKLVYLDAVRVNKVLLLIT